MDIVSAGFLVLVVFLGGVIALVADNLGRRLGKKRRSLFGLRPRHTAALITAGAGILIPFITVGIVTYASEDIRKWLFEGRQAIRESAELQKQVDGLQSKKTVLDIEVKEKVKQAKALNDRLAKVNAQLQQYKLKTQRYLEEVQKTNLRLVSLRSRLAGLTEQLAEQRRLVAIAKADVSRSKAELYKLTKGKQQLDKDIKKAVQELKLSYDENQRLGMANDDLQKKIDEIRVQIDALTSEKEKAVTELAAATQELADARANFDQEKAQMDADLKEMKQSLAAKQTELLENIDASRFQPMIFSLQEEVWRTQVPANVSESDATSLLSSMLRSARILAESRGAKANKDHASADLWPRVIEKTVLTVDEQKSQIVKSIANKGEFSVLIAYASFNAFKGEWVRLTVKGYRNPVVYTSGQTIAEGPIDGTKTDEEIVLQISDFVHSKVTTQAQKDKMIPASGRENAFGTVSTDVLLALVKEIREANRKVKLRVVAASDTRAADELKLRFVVR